MSVARRVTQALVEADWLESAQKQRFTQVMLEVDTRPPPVRAECHIVELTQTKDAYERISRIYPYGGGTGTERVTLAAATVTPAAGYTMDTTNNYLEYDAAPSRIDATVTWGDIGTQDDENATDASASNTLYYAAYNYLRQRITANEVYSLRVVGLDVIAYPGETMRVTFYRYVDGWQAVGIDDDTLNILEATTEITPDGVRTVAMQLSTAEMWPDSDAGVAVDLERRVANLERGGGIALGRIGGGTGDGGSLPGTNSATSTNEVADGLHTHQMDASADPGAAAELLKTTSDGYLDLVRLYLDALHAETGADLTVQLGDNAGVRDLSITDSDGVEVASIDSDGNATFTNITVPIALADLSDVTATAPSDNDVLSWDDGTSAWVAAAAGSGDVATDVIWDAKGDLVVGTGPDHAVRLAVGADTHVLTADSSEAAGVKWAASASGFANPMTTAGDIIYGTAGGTAVRLGIGTAGQVLTVNAGATAPEWAAASSAQKRWLNYANRADSSISTYDARTKGFILEPLADLALWGIAHITDEAADQTLRLRVYELSGTTQVGAALVDSGDISGPAGLTWVMHELGTSITLETGKRYAITLSNVSPALVRIHNSGWSIPTPQELAPAVTYWCRINDEDPSNGATWSVITGLAYYGAILVGE